MDCLVEVFVHQIRLFEQGDGGDDSREYYRFNESILDKCTIIVTSRFRASVYQN